MNILKVFRYQIIIVVFGVIVVDIFFLEKMVDLVILPVAVSWFMVLKLFDLSVKNLTMILFSFLLISLLGFTFGKMIWAEKAVSWFFILLFIAVIYNFVELKKGND